MTDATIASVTSTDVPHRARLTELANDLRRKGRLGRSEIFSRLFDFLLQQSLAGRSPKELEIAQEVFGRDTRFEIAQDASIRVTIHRLRKKLDEAYEAGEDRLVIPRGEYRIALLQADALPATLPVALDLEPAGEPPPQAAGARRLPLILLALAMVAAIVLGAAVGIAAGTWHAAAPHPAGISAFWRPLADGHRPTYVVTGDYYIFGEAAYGQEVGRLIRTSDINSHRDLDTYRMQHPDEIDRYRDLDLHYLPASIATALGSVLPVVNAVAAQGGINRPPVLAISRLSPEALKNSNLVYVGLLSGLGLLRDPLFQASAFQMGAGYGELIDRATGRRFAGQPDGAAGPDRSRRDYAYLASFPGPGGNRIVVVAGTRDAAVTQAAVIAADQGKLDQIARRVGAASGFEALFEVRTLNNLDLGSTPVVARPLALQRLWH